MAVAIVDTPTVEDSSSARGSATFSYTNTNGDGLTVQANCHNNFGNSPTVSSVTFNGDSLIKISEAHNTATAANVYASTWHIDNPDVATGNIVVTYSSDALSSSNLGKGYSGANNSVGAGDWSATGNDAAPTATATSGATDSKITGGVIIHDGANAGPLSPANGQTERADQATGGNANSDSWIWEGDITGTNGSYDFDVTASSGDPWAISGCEVLAAAAVGADVGLVDRGLIDAGLVGGGTLQ